MLHTAVLFAFLAGILGMMLGLLSARPILMAIKTPALVLERRCHCTDISTAFPC